MLFTVVEIHMEVHVMDSQVISATIERFNTEPEAARSAPAVAARVVEGRAELSTGSFAWYADLPTALGGTNTAPSPTAYLLGALAGCAVAFLRDTLAPQLGVRVDDVSAVARCTADARGLLGIDGATPDLGNVAIEITIVSSEPQSRIDVLYQAWLERCPIYLALLKSNSVSASVALEQPVGAAVV
jgi:uncharacterized OsmC-like protein